LARHKPHHKPHHPDNALTTQHGPHHRHSTTDTDPQHPTQLLAAYIRHIVDTAPRPTATQLQRLAGLLRDPGNPSAN
jgi:hypothetical protein